MKSDAMNQSWKPTLTLAKLYEEQNQFYDALAIYEIISQTDESPEIREKIDSMQNQILSDPNMKYDSRIEKLFSQEELTYLKIMNHSAFENLSRMKTQFTDGVSDYEVDLDEELASEKTTVSSFELRRMVDEIDDLAETQEPVNEPEPEQQPEAIKSDSTVNDLTEEIVKRFGKDADLNSVSVQEFMQVVMRHNLKEKNDKQ